jgi:hypothetical protein
MDNNVIDKLAREEIKNREITPSSSLWQKLENQLDAEQPKPKNRKNNRFIWLGFVLTMVSIWFVFYATQNNTGNGTNTSFQKEEKNTIIKDNIIQKKEETNESIDLPVKLIENSSEHINTSHFISPKKIITEKNQKLIHSEKNQNPEPQNNEIPVVSNLPTEEIQKSNDIAVIQTTEDKVTEESYKKSRFNPNKLLQQIEVADSGVKTNSRYNIDPNKLLKEAEKESNNRFFNKVIKTLAETSNTMVTMVNNRNVEH